MACELWTQSLVDIVIEMLEGGQSSSYNIREFLESAVRSPLSSQISSAISSINSNINSSRSSLEYTIHNEFVSHVGSEFEDLKDRDTVFLELMIKNLLISQHTNLLLQFLILRIAGKENLLQVLKELSL